MEQTTETKTDYSVIIPRVINNFERIFKKLSKNKFVVATNNETEAPLSDIKLITYLDGETLCWNAEVNNTTVLNEEKTVKQFKAFNLSLIKGILPEPVLPFNLIENYIAAKLTGIVRDKTEKDPELKLDDGGLKLYFSYGGDGKLPNAELRYTSQGILIKETIDPNSLIS